MPLWPERLSSPPRVAIFSPSSSPARFPRRQTRALEELHRHFSAVYVGAGWYRDVDGQSGSPQQRADELHELASLSDRPLLMASTGGYSCSEILRHLDFDHLARVRPAICGFSDISALLLALLARANLVSFHGPTVLPSYGEAGGVDTYTHANLLRIVCGTERTIELQPPLAVAKTSPLWELEDDVRRLRQPAEGWKSICGGIAEGPVIAANLETLEKLIATSFVPSFARCILVTEETFGPIERTRSRLKHLAKAKVFESIAALVFGRTPHGYEDDRLCSLLLSIGKRYRFPVVADFDIGHTDPKVSLPQGAHVLLDANAPTVKIHLVD